ncbi:UbiA family prenyltransferase [Streptomyces sp. NPDC007172]|uniref:UbiA family prenyltransferase n=1 Tax=Streptomyces sp. NPDC007172 TaxID=3364776 RepID=UPI0036CEF580
MHSTAAPAATRRSGSGGRLLGLLAASHPGPALTVTVVATVLAASAGRGPGGTALTASAVLTGQLSVGWCNDRADLHRDIATGRSDKPLAAGTVTPRAVATAALCALALCVPLSLANGPAAGGVHLAGVALAWSYNLGVKRTPLSWLPYAAAFGLLPAVVTLALPTHPWPAAWVMAAGALLGIGAHASNVLPDIEDDLTTGVRGLPQRLGARRARLLAAVPLLAASAVLVLGPSTPPGPLEWTGLAVTAALAAIIALPPRSGARSRLPFTATLLLAVLDAALLVLRGNALT